MGICDRNFYIRVVSAVVMLVWLIFAVTSGGLLFSVTILVISVVGLSEWHTMVAKYSNSAFNSKGLIASKEGSGTEQQRSPLEMVYARSLLWDIVGTAILLPASLSALYLGFENDKRPLILLCGVVFATDICAYLAGKAIGGIRIAPKISPKKTLAGSIGGLLGSLVFGCLFAVLAYDFRIAHIASIAAVLSLLAQIGDLLESAAKRKMGVKDSGIIIPGHGGVLDRIDSFLLTLPAMFLISLMMLP